MNPASSSRVDAWWNMRSPRLLLVSAAGAKASPASRGLYVGATS